MEISPTYKSKVITMIKALAGSDARKLVITTRVHVQRDLERELKQLSFNLVPLSDDVQEEFFEKFLKWYLIFFRDNHGNVRRRTYKEILQTIDAIKNSNFNAVMLKIKKRYRPNAVDKLDESSKSIWELDLSNVSSRLLNAWRRKIRYEDFSRNPLNLSMLIDVALTNSFEVATDLELLDIYDKFIESKFKIKFDEKDQVDRGKDSVEYDIKTVERISRDIHCELAVKLLIEEWQSMELPELSKLLVYQRMLDHHVNVNEVIAKNGLLILNGGQLKFIHRSFAEYFLNEYINKNWSNRHLQKLLFETIIRKADFQINRIFFNSSLKQEKFTCVSPMKGTGKSLIDDLKKQIPNIHKLIQEDSFEIVKIILKFIETHIPNKNSTVKRRFVLTHKKELLANGII